MACRRLEQLRAEARRVYRQLSEKLRLSQDYLVHPEPGPRAVKTDYEPFLRSQLSQLEAQIRSHLTQHDCE